MAYLTQTTANRGFGPRKLDLWRYLSIYRQRRALAALDADQLRDLGLTREMAQTEASRPFWDIA